VVFYASGRASLETSYMYQLLARLYGNNNLPDSSNMCHESTSVALPETIGVPVGTVTLDDFEQCDAIFIFGQNTGVSSPRMLHQLQDARRAACPSSPSIRCASAGWWSSSTRSRRRDAHARPHQVSTQYLQVKNGGDLAALTGLCKALIEADDRARAEGGARVLDAASSPSTPTASRRSPRRCGRPAGRDRGGVGPVARGELETAAATFANARAVIGIYGMGLTQHRKGVENVQMVSNLLLLGGHIGRPGAGICPVRGHSNVQGQRTVGITEKPELAPLDKLAELYGFEPPREKGLNTVEACEGVLAGGCAPSSGWAATSCARCPTPTGSSRPGVSCGSRCRSPPSSTAATSCTARCRTCCRAWGASRSTGRPAASRP
jgi:anaerobic selenocysteine-containing dehydrogenase